MDRIDKAIIVLSNETIKARSIHDSTGLAFNTIRKYRIAVEAENESEFNKISGRIIKLLADYYDLIASHGVDPSEKLELVNGQYYSLEKVKATHE